MMENPRSEEEKIIKDIRNFFKLKKEQNDTAIKNIRNIFRLKKVTGIKDIALRNIKRKTLCSVIVLCYKINSNRGRSYTDSPAWIKKQKSNNINKKDNDCFQYVVTVVLNYEEIKKDPQRITKITPFISKYKRKEINFYQKRQLENI